MDDTRTASSLAHFIVQIAEQIKQAGVPMTPDALADIPPRMVYFAVPEALLRLVVREVGEQRFHGGDFDRDHRLAARRQALGTARRTKGRRSRALPIHSDLRRMLKQLPAHEDGRLLHGPRGGRLKPDTVRNVLMREVLGPLKKQFPTPAGEVGFEHGRVHSFRHFFVSQCFRAGVDEGEIKSWVGHRDSRMVAHYRHLRSEESRQRMQQVYFFGKPAPADGPRNRPSQPASRGADRVNPTANGENEVAAET